MLSLTARAIKTGDVWVVQVPSRRLRVIVDHLCDTDRAVEAVLNARSQSQRPIRAGVQITVFLDLDDCCTAERQALEDLVSSRALRPRALRL